MKNTMKKQPQNTFFTRCKHWCTSRTTAIKGLIALALGIFLVFLTRRMIIGFFVMSLGFYLTYHGMCMLGFARMCEPLKNFFRKMTGK